MANKVLCVIPCRTGSKRLPDKTRRLFKGKPLIKWTIEQARTLFNKSQIIINTDYDFEGATIDGVNFEDIVTLYKRPEHLCGDNISTESVLRDMLKDYPECEMIVLLQLTSPNRKIETIKNVIKSAHALSTNVASGFNAPDGQVYVWFTDKPWGNWEYEQSDYATDINTQLDFEVAEVLHGVL